MGTTEENARENIEWIETHCHVPDGMLVGQKVVLRPFQREILMGIYSTPTRTAIASFARKNAKTTLAAMICLLHLVGPEAKRNSQLISAAQSRDQAALLFDLMSKMIRMSPVLNTELTIRDTNKQVLCPALGTLYTAVSAEAKTKFGASPILVVHDELGQVVGPRSPLYEALESGSGAHEAPLSIIISTQAPTDADLLSILIDDAKTGADPKTKVFLWTADEDLDPFLVEAQKEANPAYGLFLNVDELANSAKKAERMPSLEAAYRNLNLNQRVNVYNPFVSAGVWRENAADPRMEDFERGNVVCGLDLSERNDLTALVLTATGEDGNDSILCHFYAPKEGVVDRARRDRVPYDLWAEQGFLTLCEGATVDYEYVARELIDIRQRYNLSAVKFDRWRMKYLKKELERLEYDFEDLLHEHGQGYMSMGPALDAFEADLLNQRLRHGNNPILTWCAANAVVLRDPAGNRKLDKSKSTGKIDGMIALAMTRDVFDEELAPSGGLVVA